MGEDFRGGDCRERTLNNNHIWRAGPLGPAFLVKPRWMVGLIPISGFGGCNPRTRDGTRGTDKECGETEGDGTRNVAKQKGQTRSGTERKERNVTD